MYSFVLNGENISTDEDKRLLDYLRDDKRITSVKNGCNGEGVCGACSVLINGKKRQSCRLNTSDVNGKEIITIEGLSDEEKDIYTCAFTEAGAVQCGFCTPGMVISAKSLLDNNLNPTIKDIKNAINGNICRCTGYVKIEKAISLAAKAMREGLDFCKDECKGFIGENLNRIDAREKILGIGEFVDDMYVEGMLYGSALRTKYPRALVNNIDISDALKHPEVEAILTAKDVPGERYIGHIIKDWPALIAEGEETRYIGDAIALVAARSKKGLKEILDLIKVEYEELKPLTNPEEAMKENAPNIHEKGNILTKEVLKRGKADEIIAKSKYVVTKKYSTPFTDHAFLEPESALAVMEDDNVKIYTGCQGIYPIQRECSELLGIKPERIRVINKFVGGAFGGKEDVSVQHHAALLTWHTKKPVKVTLTRLESLYVHPKRHAMEMEFTTACDENGKLTAMKSRIIADTGAYASLGGPVLQRACTHAAGPYNYQNIDIEGLAIYTNNPPAGAFRGFGVTQSLFATECNLNILAEKVGISPFDIRYINAIEPGMILPNGQIAAEDTALKETLIAVKDEYDNNKYVGIACAIKNTGLGVGLSDIGRCRLSIIDNKVHIRTAASCMGQGLATIALQIFHETTKLDINNVIVDEPDTSITPDSGMSTASRQTLFTGEAIRLAAIKLNKALETYTLDELEGKDFYGEYRGITDPMGSNKINPISHVAYSYATDIVILDENGRINKIVAAHDIGRAINPKNLEGQIEGGVVMGIGYALTEDFPLKESVPIARYGTLGLFRANNVPDIESILIGKSNSFLSYGAKGIGEISAIPIAPAVAGAYLEYDKIFRNKLPLENTPYYKKKK